ncbi:MAG: hypothetical protein IJ866_00215 [Alphaproteobacteria bacterium]|nr:hypothetical protein [Alphaproteobacteria bacterium]
MPDKKPENIDMNKMPALTMNINDKLFFALARRDTDTLSYVYSLVINREQGSYPAEMKTEISAFKDTASANLYYETATLVMEQQQSGILNKIHELFRGMFESQITAFNKSASGFKTRTK